MKNPFCHATFIGLTAAILLPIAGFAQEPPNPLFEKIEQADKELWELQLKIDELYRLTPICDPAEEEETTRTWAKRTGELEAIDVKLLGSERLKFADGSPMDLEMIRQEVSGRDSYGKLYDFLTRFARRSYRIADLERLHLKAEAGDTVQFTARFALPCYKQAPETPSEWTGIEDAMAQILAHRREAYQTLSSLSEANAARFVQALAAFEREMGKRPVALTEARLLGEEIILDGVIYGAAAQASLEPALEKAGFRDRQIKLLPADACQKFSLAARLEAGEQESEDVSWNGLFDDQTAAVCEMPPPAVRVVAKGTSTSPDALTLHLREVDLVDVFFILYDLTSQSFVVDPDVKGRVSVDIEGATLEEALAAMGSAGVTVGTGPLHRVSPAGRQPAAAIRSSYIGELMDVFLKDAALVHFLCTLEQVTQRQVLAPRELKGEVRLFASNLPWDQLLEGLLASAGYTSVVEDKRVLIGPGPETNVRALSGLVSACEIPVTEWEPSSRLASTVVSLPELGVADLSLAGLARQGDVWKAYAYPPPRRRLLQLESGAKLLDGSITSIGPEGVGITTGGSEVVTISLRP